MNKEKRVEFLLTVINKAESYSITFDDHKTADNVGFFIRKISNPDAIFLQERSVIIYLDDTGEYLDEDSDYELIGDY